MIIVERFFPRHVARLCFQDKADRLPGFPIIERKCLFAAHMEQQIALSDAASKNCLNRINATGIIFCNTDNLFII